MVTGQLSAESYFKWDITVCRLQMPAASSQEKIVLKQAVTLPMGLPREAVSRCLFQSKAVRKYCRIYENIRKQLFFLLGACQFYNLCMCIRWVCNILQLLQLLHLLVGVSCVWDTICTLAGLSFQAWFSYTPTAIWRTFSVNQRAYGKAGHQESQQMLCGVCYCFSQTD